MAEKNNSRRGLSSCALHIMAMALMLSDHLWATLFPNLDVLTCIGRLAFPIFAFMTAEGFFHTHDLKKYLLRLFVFALISEIPFDLVYGSTVFYPFHQNVLWTFLIALLLIAMIERVRAKNRPVLTALAIVGAAALGFALGYLFMTDYYGGGVLTVLAFYLFRGRKPWQLAGQLLALIFVNAKLLAGYCWPVTLFGHEFDVPQQAIAILAFIPILLYNGRQGYHAKWFQYFCYAFYPLHLAVLYVLWQALL